MAIVLKVEVFGLLGRGDEIEKIFIDMARQVHELELRCLRYDVARSRERPDNFVVWEIYADQGAFEEHRQTRHFKTLMTETLPGHLRGRRRDLYDPVA